MISVNELVNQALKEVSLIGDDESAQGDLADSAVALLNSAIRKLNSDSYFASSVDKADVSSARFVCFRKLEAGEANDGHTIDQEPPEFVEGVARKLGIRYLPLKNCDPQFLDQHISGGMPSFYSYSTYDEVAPSGNHRMVGKVELNGSGNCPFRIYYTHRLAVQDLYSYIYVSEIYHDALFWTLCVLLCGKYHLDDYKQHCLDGMNAALSLIDRQTLNNRAMANGGFASGYDTWSVGYDLGGGNLA